MKKHFNIGIIGATGAVGIEAIKLIEDRYPDYDINLRLFASKRSANKVINTKFRNLQVEELNHGNIFKELDYAIFSAGKTISLEYAPQSVKNDCVVIDNTSAYRMDKNVPLVIPEINPETLKEHNGIIANPNCSTIILLMAIYPIHMISPINKIIVSTYQAVSGAGMSAIEELYNESKAYLNNESYNRKKFPHQVAFNVFSHETDINTDGYNMEEEKMINECHKILKNDIEVIPTCIRVPIPRCHSESIYIETENHINIDEIKQSLSNFDGVKIVDDPINNHYPMPSEASQKYDVFVGRIRKVSSKKNAYSLFCCGDQLLKGAALNAVQILDKFIHR